MKHHRPVGTWTKGPLPNRVQADVLPPIQVGLSAALRRAFAAPADNEPCDFGELLKRLD